MAFSQVGRRMEVSHYGGRSTVVLDCESLGAGGMGVPMMQIKVNTLNAILLAHSVWNAMVSQPCILWQ